MSIILLLYEVLLDLVILGHDKTIAYEPWPTYIEEKTIDETIELPIQINGKLKAKLSIALDQAEETVKKAVHENEVIQSSLAGKTIVKEIYVKNKIYNIVVKG